MRTLFFPFLLTFLTALLAACGSQPGTVPDKGEQHPANEAEQIQRLLSEAEQVGSPIRERKQLQASSLLLKAGQYDLVEQIISGVQATQLPLEDYARYTAVAAQLNIQRGLYPEALQILDTQKLLEGLDSLPMSQQL